MVNKKKKDGIEKIIKSLSLEDITQIVNSFTDTNITTKMVVEELEFNFKDRL